jgi:hypothetical protein|tara:strand:- start:2861 stop:3202 length:342 start_codon:yes stop_codon:yes gene_type:complete
MGTVSIGIITDISMPAVTSGTIGGPTAISDNSASTAVPANSARNSLSIAITVNDAWIRLMPSATDSTVRKGFPVSAGQTWILPTSWWRSLYSGEVSIINAVDGQAPVYYVTEL